MLKNAFKISFELVLISILLILLIWHNLVMYGISQGKGQLSIVWNAKPLENIFNDASISDSVKQKLKLVSEIKQFAIDSLGINPSENYSTFYDQTNQPKLLTISACEAFSFKAKEWTFPFLGTVSYKGFFNKEEAKKEIEKLKEQNYDVDVYVPSGWSTLGWFKDPILSNMLRKSEGDLANLIIHELTHGTLYVKNDVTFNENLASFIGDKGAEQFLIRKFGINSKSYIDYEQSKTDEKIYNEYILKSAARLDSLYHLLGRGNSEEDTRREKKILINEIVVGVYRLPLYKKQLYFNFSLQAFSEGNAFFMAFTRYDSQYDLFEKEYKEKYNSNLKKYLNAMKEKYPSL
ncbi:MAG: hypothetical protein A3F72_00365 [Bacteroidetes bacterium RIFCSPLOWO2_12_FULL_35_15]|nr:MAG: hypothetical protein A3F72_00365 [Bacteroidetes bacterium RIFCSPLOWO2_12_FULL_35_15]